jgi:transposase InsO family protein
MTPRTIGVGESHQNGDVESLNGALKRRLKQHLLLRGSRDFDSVEEYERWVQDVLRETNELRSKWVTEELAAMKPLRVNRLPEYTVEQLPVTSRSTIRIKHNRTGSRSSTETSTSSR